MSPEETRKMKRLEDAVRTAYVRVDDLLVDIHPRPGPNGRVQWARTKSVRDDLLAALNDVRPDETGTIAMVLTTGPRF